MKKKRKKQPYKPCKMIQACNASLAKRGLHYDKKKVHASIVKARKFKYTHGNGPNQIVIKVLKPGERVSVGTESKRTGLQRAAQSLSIRTKSKYNKETEMYEVWRLE